MRHVLLGLGSIGKRHYNNLRLLAPEDEILTVDPQNSQADLRWPTNVEWRRDDVVYICTPTKNHLMDVGLLIYHQVRAIFVEKPLYEKGATVPHTNIPIVCGYNYRFYSDYQSLYEQGGDIALMNVIGIENIQKKYGYTALETMLSHYLDLGLWLFGVPELVQIVDRGWCATASLNFKDSAQMNVFSQIDGHYHRAQAEVVHSSGECIKINLGDKTELDAMYVKEMVAWLNFLETGERGQLCFLEEALRVQLLMAEAK